jgi:alkylation response protein AidB-like acyl-CoA dehydrogenase
MDFSLSEEQQALRAATIAFAQHELNNAIAERDASATFDRMAWQKCAEFGILGSYIPISYAGRGYDMLTAVLQMEALGYGCHDNGLTLGLNGQMWAVQEPILAFGSEEQKQRFLPRLVSGEWLGAHGMTEPQSGSDAYSMQTSATKVSGGYHLNGRKIYIGLAPVANLALIFATTNPKHGRWGVSAFLVEAASAGFYASEPQAKMGLRTSPLGEIVLEDCFVPEANRLGPEGAGVSIFNASMDYERSFIFASHVGAMAYQLDRAIAYAKERSQFGQAIGKFQAVSHRIADMKIRLEAARLLLYQAAWLKTNGQPAALEAAITKVFVSESFVEGSLDAIRIHGARGYMAEHEIERDLRDSTGGVIYSGTNDIQRNVIAALLGL